MTMENSGFDSFGEQTKLINQALKFTSGDVEKARLMAAGQYNDVVVVKGRFLIEENDVYGVFLIFANTKNQFLLNVSTLLFPDELKIEKIRIFDKWKTFYADMNKLVQAEGDHSIGSFDFSNHLSDSLNGYDLYEDMDNKNLDSVSKSITEIISRFYSMPAQCQIDLEETNSLMLELDEVPFELKGTAEKSGMPDTDDAEDGRLEKIENEAAHVIPGKVLVSPVRGKYINDVKIGEVIKVQLSGQDDISRSVAKAHNAITEEGDYIPIKGRLKEKVPLGKSGFILYTLVAKNILAKILEEENVKIEMESAGNEPKEEKSESRLILYFSLLIGLIVIILLGLFFIL